MDGLSDFLAVMGYAWKLLTMERYIYGFVFSYGRLVLMLVTSFASFRYFLYYFHIFFIH